ncbi:MAG TPA: hypothetical protein VGH23_10925 [Rhizomicrobium sp.]|jgi:hypothetical protein
MVPSPLFRRLAAPGALLLLFACAPQSDTGYRVVTADVTYGATDRRDREWRALMTAMDRCHQGGFADAQPDRPPQTRCLESGPGGCTRFAEHLAWDCIGMGYQQN